MHNINRMGKLDMKLFLLFLGIIVILFLLLFLYCSLVMAKISDNEMK